MHRVAFMLDYHLIKNKMDFYANETTGNVFYHMSGKYGILIVSVAMRLKVLKLC